MSNMDYELGKRLKDAGFPQKHLNLWDDKCYKEHSLGMATACCGVYIPTLSELIEACGDDFMLTNECGKWEAFKSSNSCMVRIGEAGAKYECEGTTPEIAVANLMCLLYKVESSII